MANLVNQSLYDCVSSVLKSAGTSPLILTKGLLDGLLRAQFQNDRELPAQARRAAKQHFRETVRRHLAERSITLLPKRVEEFADWVYSNPAARCPGYRLAWEARRSLVNNVTEKVSGNDMFDHAIALAVPYVDAVTMDGNAADRCRKATARLKEQNRSINYEERIFTSVKEMLDAKF